MHGNALRLTSGVTPDSGRQALAAKHLTGIGRERVQEFEFDVREIDFGVAYPDHVAATIDSEIAEGYS